MAGRGPQTFKKRQKEQQRKERQQAKLERRIQRRSESENRPGGPEIESLPEPEPESEAGEPAEPLVRN